MDKELVAEAMLGRDAEEFVQSQIGQYIIGAAEQEAKMAAEELARVFPWRRRRIQYLQNQIWRAQSIQSWLAELIIKGKQAMSNLDQE
jgi:hypothetical protein